MTDLPPLPAIFLIVVLLLGSSAALLSKLKTTRRDPMPRKRTIDLNRNGIPLGEEIRAAAKTLRTKIGNIDPTERVKIRKAREELVDEADDAAVAIVQLIADYKAGKIGLGQVIRVLKETGETWQAAGALFDTAVDAMKD